MATADFSSSIGFSSTSSAALQKQLLVLSRRRNAQKMTRALIRAAVPGVGLAALSIALYKLHIIPDGPLWAPAAMVGFSLLWGIRNGLMQRAGSFAAACDADRALGLDDRLSSALAFAAPNAVQKRTRIAAVDTKFGRIAGRIAPRFALSTSPAVAPTILVPHLVDQAAARAQNLDANRVYPLRFDRPAQILSVVAVLLLGACLMPDLPIFQTPLQRQQVVAMQSAGEKLMEVAKSVRKTAPPKAEAVKSLSARLQKLGQKMVRGRMTKRAALTEMGELRQQLQKAQKKSAAAQSTSMPQIAEAIRQSPLQSETGRKVQQQLDQNKPEDAAKKLEELADKVEKGNVSPEEKKKAAEDLEKVAENLKSRGGAANEQAAKQLEQAAQQLKQSQQNSQQQQNQSPQNGQQQQGQKSGEQKPQGQQPQQQGQSPQGNQKSQAGQKQQSGQQSQQKQNSQSQSGAQQGQQQKQQGGQQGQSQQGGSQQGKGEQGSQQSAADSLRNMANGLKAGSASGGDGKGLQDMIDKIRSAENQTGSNGGEQFGNVKPGKGGGSMPGSGQMKMVTPGKDLMPTDPHGAVNGGAGLGPRNNAMGNMAGGGVSKVKANRTGDKRRYDDVWSDRLPKTRAKIDRVKGKWGGSGEVEQMPTKGEAKGGQVKTPYYQVYESYKRDQEEAVSRETVPQEYKQPVKDYFESIKP